MELTLSDLRSMALDGLLRKFKGVIVQPHVGVILRRGTMISTIQIYDHELLDNKHRLEDFLNEKSQDAALMLNAGMARK